nr:MAG TPA: hypothetical protein [Caudoviricetes sp.]
MNDDTRQEVIKAVAAGMADEDIANFAEITEDELTSFKIDYSEEITNRKKEMERFGL